MIQPPSALILEADTLRKAGDWTGARHRYQAAQRQLPENAVVAHNLALCHLALGEGAEAIVQSRRAMTLNPRLWQSGLVLAKALISRNEKATALPLLQRLHQQQPGNGEIRLELATLTLHQLGDPLAARTLVEPLLGTPQHGRDALITKLVTELYDRDADVSSIALNQAFLDFAAEHLQLEKALVPVVTPQRQIGKARLRVGLLSPQFFASPVYFFSIGVLQHLAQVLDLVFFSRGSKSDWATDAFKGIAHDWVDVALFNATQLAQALAEQRLDALIDLGGWMDPVALQALSVKPAKKLFKWVGGQSITTGLKTFDGFITDRYQTPAGSDALYSEPLIRLKSGYVTYTPPPYMPPPSSARNSEVQLGIIANPAKVSRAFLADLAKRHRRWKARDDGAVGLRFIDYRYQNATVRTRIEAALPGIELQFVTPASHRDYLTALSRLDATVDTWPYSGGLTTIEALAVGVPAYTHIGELFCERHTAAHCKYAGFNLGECRIERFDSRNHVGPGGVSLLKPDSPRVDHATLASELLTYLSPGAPIK